MIKINDPSFPFYTFHNLASHKSTKHFVSSGIHNIGFSDEADPEQIQENRHKLSIAVGFNIQQLTTGHQIHSANIKIVTETETGCGALDKESRLADTDAMITNRKGVCLIALSADCVPVLLYDPQQNVIAAIHAGWKGTAAGIAPKTVQMMQEKFGCRPENILAGIGPSIGPCCFEVGEEVARIFTDLLPNTNLIISGKAKGKFQVDLWKANCQELVAAGLKTANIEIAGMCSVCHPDHFFSYRRDGQQAGRFGAGIMLCE